MKIMAYKKIILVFAFSIFIFELCAQQISQLGIWNNNANFVIKYYQDRVITSTTSGIVFLDVSNPNNPTPTCTLSIPSYFPMTIEIDNNYAFFGGGMTGYFMIADISNINSPVLKGITYAISGTAYQLAIKGNYAFMPTNSDTLYSIDISNKIAPFVAGKIYVGFSYGIKIKGNYAYVSTTTGGLRVVDISNPTNLSVITSIGSTYNRISADTLNNRLFVAKGSGFDVVDISNPANPAVLFQGTGGSTSGDLVYKDGYVYQIGGGLVSAYQISTSSATFITSFNSTITGQVNGVSAKDSVFYLSTTQSLHVLKFGQSINTGMSDMTKSDYFSFFPNPANTQISIITQQITTEGNISIFNVNGQELIKQPIKNNETNIDISKLPKGIYILKFVTGKTVEVRKIVKE